MMQYEKIFDAIKKDGLDWRLNFTGIDFFNSFEINDLIFYLANQEKFDEFERIDFSTNEGGEFTHEYFKKIGMSEQLVNIAKNVKENIIFDDDNNSSCFFDHIKLYRFKQDFYGEYENIFEEFSKIGFSQNNAALITSSIGEIIDNAFHHNLGRWNSSFGPLVILLAQNIADKKEINISICDFGVGFMETLRKNYHELQSEAEAIELAIKPKVTGRLNKMGGNGLVYLQKNIFNGFSGEIAIRSMDTIVSVKREGGIELLKSDLPFKYGANVFISLKY